MKRLKSKWPQNEDGCNVPCAGDFNVMCGGTHQNSIYFNTALMDGNSLLKPVFLFTKTTPKNTDFEGESYKDEWKLLLPSRIVGSDTSPYRRAGHTAVAIPGIYPSIFCFIY
jgi:hypothetical protein